MAWLVSIAQVSIAERKKPFGLPSCFHQPQASTVILAQGGRWPHSTLPSLPGGPGCKQMVGVGWMMRPAPPPHPPLTPSLVPEASVVLWGQRATGRRMRAFGKWGGGCDSVYEGILSLCYGPPLQQG